MLNFENCSIFSFQKQLFYELSWYLKAFSITIFNLWTIFKREHSRMFIVTGKKKFQIKMHNYLNF